MTLLHMKEVYLSLQNTKYCKCLGLSTDFVIISWNFNLTLNVKWCSEPQIFLGSCSCLWNEYHSLLHQPFVKRSFSSERQDLNNLKPEPFMITLGIILVTMFLKEMQLKAVMRNNPEQILSSEEDNLKKIYEIKINIHRLWIIFCF